MAMRTIDLSMSYDHGMGGPSDSEHYPDFTYDSPEPLELPDEGVMKIRFRKARSSERLMGDHKMHSCTVEVLAIESVKAAKTAKQEAIDDAPVKSDHSAEEALDALMSEKMQGKY